MLKEFDVPEKDKGRYISVEPTTQAIKNSLDIIGKDAATQAIPTRGRSIPADSPSSARRPVRSSCNPSPTTSTLSLGGSLVRATATIL